LLVQRNATAEPEAAAAKRSVLKIPRVFSGILLSEDKEKAIGFS
jgi:hypothetical protein